MPDDTTQATQELSPANVYEGGKLMPVTVAELLSNEVALRQVVNDLNLTRHEVEKLRAQITPLNSRAAAGVTQRAYELMFGVVNIIGAILIAIGVNFLTSVPPIRTGAVLTALGAILTLLISAAPLLRPWLEQRLKIAQT